MNNKKIILISSTVLIIIFSLFILYIFENDNPISKAYHDRPLGGQHAYIIEKNTLVATGKIL